MHLANAKCIHMHLGWTLIEAATGRNPHNCSWNSHTGRICQEHGPGTGAHQQVEPYSDVYSMQAAIEMDHQCVALNLEWRKCKIFLGSNFLLVAQFLFVLSCIRPKKRHPKETVVPEEKEFNLSQIYSGPYLPKVFIDSRLSGRLTPAVSGRKRPFKENSQK